MFTHNRQQTSAAVLARVQQSYSNLTGAAPRFSLLELFNFEGFNLNDYCQTFSPHPQIKPLLQEARAFGEQYGIWLDNAAHYISCATFLYPNAGLERMRAIVQNLAIDYYLNDTMGRDIFVHLSPAEQEAATQMKKRMYSLREDLYMDEPNATLIEQANVEVLTYIRDTSSMSWFKEFLRLYSWHIYVAHKDCNMNAAGKLASVDEYIDSRCHLSGMHHVVKFIEYSEGLFLDWDWLAERGIHKQLERLHDITAAIGGLMNDLFSFEKEVIRNGADSNLVMVILCNQPALTLEEGIRQAAGIVRNQLIEFLALMDYVKTAVQQEPLMLSHLQGLERCVQASWIWQVYTRRYKSADSIFVETRLPGVAAPQ
ncbi:hypothetical protein SAMN04488505_10967 [Chitinophaga rupis]|uniref:Terpene synthase n=1 Tax=Chitinophaga rupis TaxID=573321 RepID=A0A1H8F0X3_9BACT|nr:terpene synthase family protein [Chitinophaga rupis]SEN24648.1 hypothetical protein SAMN04488505_10967 [Chitinophaga rupis]